jgi:hypothetical protein
MPGIAVCRPAGGRQAGESALAAGTRGIETLAPELVWGWGMEHTLSTRPPHPADRPPPVFEVGSPAGLPIDLLKAAVLAQVESGDARVVIDLTSAGPLDSRAVGTLLYAQALCEQAGGSLSLRLSHEQRVTLAPHTALLVEEQPV